MPLKPCLFAVGVVAAAPLMAQDTALAIELAEIEAALTELEDQSGRYEGGLILSLMDARREALLLAKILIQTRLSADSAGIQPELVMPAVQPDEARASQLLGEMGAAQERIRVAEQEAAAGGGLIQALAQSRVEAERLTLAQLQMGYLQAKYGIAFPTFAQLPAENDQETDQQSIIAEPSDVAISTVSWADPRFPQVDYTITPFEQAHRDGQGISGWWTIERSRAPVDDSPQVTALNHSEFKPNSFMGLTGLVARCVEGESAFIFVQDDYLLNDFRSNTFNVTLRVDDEPAVQARWGGLTSNKGAGLFGREAENFMRTIYDADQLFIRLVESNGQQHDALFALAGSRSVFDEVASACGWTTLSLTVDDYRAIQALLNAGGFDVGTPDGQWGPASQSAMRAFQASMGLPETGAPDRATLESLGIR